jgi:hypothetical protein
VSRRLLRWRLRLTTSADVARLRAGTGAVVLAVQQDLATFWAHLDLTRPEKARDALVAYVPRLITTYGDAAGTIAADWYEQTRAAQVAGGFRAITAAAPAAAVTKAAVRYGAGHLFTENPAGTLAFLTGAVQRQTLAAARATIVSNVSRDPARPRYARVPSGARTCAFCAMLASRGFVYASKQTAGAADQYHDHCDCQLVAEWSQHPAIDGYNPGRFRSMYEQARDASGNDANTIAAAMRRMFPDQLKDGVVSDAP